MILLPAGVPLAKRLFDLVFSLIGSAVLSPLFAILGFAIFLLQGSPVLFRQIRPGISGRPFEIYKFRTMAPPSAGKIGAASDAERITHVGRFLRATSLDELPELFNVLKGDMSLVGPRPLLMQYLDRYTAEQARRHEVLPGITGWAQINGRNALDWEEKFRLDVWYVEHWSFWLDVRIILETVWRVMRREGITQSGHASAEEFLGSSARK
jgi:lipopolysaccharide/colanic/teichoic acid biosynthesis glycosyltransferase